MLDIMSKINTTFLFKIGSPAWLHNLMGPLGQYIYKLKIRYILRPYLQSPNTNPLLRLYANFYIRVEFPLKWKKSLSFLLQ